MRILEHSSKPLQLLLSPLQTAPRSSHILQKTHQPVWSMTEHTTSSFCRGSQIYMEPLQVKGTRSLPGCRAGLWHVTTTTLLAISCRNTPWIDGKHQELEVIDLDSCPRWACFSFAKSFALDFPVEEGVQDHVRAFLWKCSEKCSGSTQRIDLFWGAQSTPSSSPSKQAAVSKKWFLYFKMHLSLNKLFYHE